jgi:hypothetical protein
MAYNQDFLNNIRSDVKTDVQARITHIGVGDDDTTPTNTDSTLGNETFRDSVDSYDTSEVNNIIASLLIATTENNGNDIDEVAAFDAASSGNLAFRKLINTISKTSDIQVYLDCGNEISVTEDTT